MHSHKNLAGKIYVDLMSHNAYFKTLGFGQKDGKSCVFLWGKALVVILGGRERELTDPLEELFKRFLRLGLAHFHFYNIESGKNILSGRTGKSTCL